MAGVASPGLWTPFTVDVALQLNDVQPVVDVHADDMQDGPNRHVKRSRRDPPGGARQVRGLRTGQERQPYPEDRLKKRVQGLRSLQLELVGRFG